MFGYLFACHDRSWSTKFASVFFHRDSQPCDVFSPRQTNLAKGNKSQQQIKPPPRVDPDDCWQNLVPRRRPGWDLQFPSPPNVSCWETMWQKISTAVKRSAAFCCPLEHSPPGAHPEPASNVCSLPMTHPQQNELRAAGSLANKHPLICTDCRGTSPTYSRNPADRRYKLRQKAQKTTGVSRTWWCTWAPFRSRTSRVGGGEVGGRWIRVKRHFRLLRHFSHFAHDIFSRNSGGFVTVAPIAMETGFNPKPAAGARCMSVRSLPFFTATSSQCHVMWPRLHRDIQMILLFFFIFFWQSCAPVASQQHAVPLADVFACSLLKAAAAVAAYSRRPGNLLIICFNGAFSLWTVDHLHFNDLPFWLADTVYDEIFKPRTLHAYFYMYFMTLHSYLYTLKKD